MSNLFETLGLRPELMQAINESGYTEPTPVQVSAIPELLAGRDVIGQAQTGTGKTAAFSLPMLHMMDFNARGIQALILTPTRELAMQVSNNIFRYGKNLGVRVLAIYGGTSYDRQMRRLEKLPHIVVGTPGRTLDLLNRGTLDFSTVKYVVLDEADEMLKMGFIEDVESILQSVPQPHQTALFSATFSDTVRELSRKYMNTPVEVTIERKQLTVPQIEQRYYLVPDESKLAALSRLLETEDMKSALIFTRTRAGSAELAASLLERGFVADALHGELNQPAREAVLRRFRSGQLPVLVATDVVARGVDIPDVSHVFNFDIPYDPEDYVHRIGRTGRAGRAGVAIMLITPRERRRLRQIEDYIKKPIERAELPKLEEVRAKRDQRFIESLNTMLEGEDTSRETALIAELVESGYDLNSVAAAAIHMARADEYRRPVEHIRAVREEQRGARDGGERRRGDERRTGDRRDIRRGQGGEERRPRRTREVEPGMVRLSIALGHNQGIRPGDIVGAIASEAGIPGKAIGAIDIQNDRTFFDVKAAHVDRVLSLRQSKLRGKPMQIGRA